MTTVVNKNTEPFDVYIGRGSIFGNPYEIGVDGTREQVIARYEKWFNFLLRDSAFLEELKKLAGKRLGCFCKPQQCHGEIIAEFLNNDGFSIVRHEQAQEAMQAIEGLHSDYCRKCIEGSYSIQIEDDLFGCPKCGDTYAF
jgi:hypothetical protein